MKCRVELNDKLNGVEIYFEIKPERNIIDEMKGEKFRYNGKKSCWYAKQTDSTLSFANKLEKQNETIVNLQEKTGEAEILKNKIYYPSYHEVDGTELYETSQQPVGSLRGGYFADTNCKVKIYNNYVQVLELSNALQVGKECMERRIVPEDHTTNEFHHIVNMLREENILSMSDLINAKEIKGFTINEATKKSSRVFSPFVQVKPIISPTKWTKAHVWKAILSGQIFDGITKGNYTDDYASDAAHNFGKGRSVDLIALAKELIENNSGGVRISVDEVTDGVTSLSVSRYTYNYKTLYFDVDCNLDLKQKRQEESTNTLEKFNETMMSQVLEINQEAVEEQSIYSIEYLVENRNTGQYKTRNKLVFSDRLYTDHECNYDILKIEKFAPEDNILYSLSNFHNRESGEDYKDERIIDLGNFQKVVTGYALKEMLEEDMTFVMVQEGEPKTIEAAKALCEKFINGTMTSMFSSEKTEYSLSLEKLYEEEQRIIDGPEQANDWGPTL